MTEPEHPYEISVDLSVVEALGINLYSNAAAVLSELVANSYDGDATRVSIDWKKGANNHSVVVSDNGVGMTAEQLNERFLKVGYKKREHEGTESVRWHRPYMGRKGIGKLSVFSIAETVSVFSRTEEGSSNGLQIKVPELLAAIKRGESYHPTPVEVPTEYSGRGTFIVLDELKTKRAGITANALRKRLARRFDVLHNTPEADGGFYVDVNDTTVTWADRQELKKLQFIWEFGEQTLPAHALPTDITRFVLADNVIDADKDWKISGWIGTAEKPTDLTDDHDAGSLKNVIVLARKRPIQEGIIEKLDFSRIFGNYVTGQIEADFLDLDEGYEDIATSDRQRLIEDDERVKQLLVLLRNAFVKAADDWSKHRRARVTKDTLEQYPKLREWIEARPQWQQESAEDMIGTIAGIVLEKGDPERHKTELFRAGVLAFERLLIQQNIEDLRGLATMDAAHLLPLLGRQNAYEEGLWVDILRSRVEAISQFRGLTEDDEKEKVLQEFLYQHLWLLDPSWERATGSERMEENLRKIEPGLIPKDDREDEITGRMDVRYATAGGKHVIVELKRYSRQADVEELRDQGLKYYRALTSVLTQQQRGGEPIEVVFVIGDIPGTVGRGNETESEYIRDRLKGINGRYVLYDALIENTSKQYEEYLSASETAQQLEALLSQLEPEDDSSAEPTTPASHDSSEGSDSS